MLDLDSILIELKKKKILIDRYSKLKESFNSRTFKLEEKNGKNFFLKDFIKDPINKHNRIRSEVCFTQYLKRNTKNNVPDRIA